MVVTLPDGGSGQAFPGGRPEGGSLRLEIVPVVPQIDVALDVRETSHMSAGMLAYVRALRRELPGAAAGLRLAAFGSGDNFDRAEQVAMPVALATMRPRLAHFPTPFVPRLVPVPYVVTVHDVIDLEFPQFVKAKVAPYWRFVVAPVLRAARAVITDDEATAALLERYAGVPRGNVRVVALGVDAPDPLPPAHVRSRPYFFYAGNHRPHKDLRSLVAAWLSLPASISVDLLMTSDAPAAFAARPGGSGDLVFVGTADDTRLWSLHRGALAYVQPALREGFGLPALEALRAGTPVIASDPATPAILAPHVARYPAGDVAALRTALLRAYEAPLHARAQVAASRELIAALTWARTARETAAVYRTLLAEGAAA